MLSCISADQSRHLLVVETRADKISSPRNGKKKEEHDDRLVANTQ
jgi:hypothetical protein